MINLSSSQSSQKYIMVLMLSKKDNKKLLHNILEVLNTHLWNKVLREFHITMANIVFCLILGRSKTFRRIRVGYLFGLSIQFI